jgi:hypothetical protein
MNCIDCRYNLLKDGNYNCTYEEGECIKISVLEKENAELERKLEQTEKDLADYQFNYPTIKELQKENAELKAHHKSVCDTLTNTHRNLREQLIEAKEIIRELLNSCFGYNSKTVNYEVKVKAEQFLKEDENA